ncbi:MAG: hypothetical protein AAFW89_09370 [Bacteroidota bacterium]
MYRFILITGCILFIASCSNQDDEDVFPEGSIVIAETVRDTVLTIPSFGTEIRIPISLPRYGTQMPAVVVMHGSGGNWKDEDTNGDGIADSITFWELSNQNKEWKSVLNENGYVSAFPGSYYPRGAVENEGDWKNPPDQFKISATFVRNHDAYATLTMLRQLRWTDGTPIVDPDAVGIIGFSHGGTAVQSTVFDQSAIPANWEWRQSFSGTEYTADILQPAPIPEEGGFKAAITYYPGSFHNSYYGNPCTGNSIYRPYTDLLVHIAENDVLTSNTLCFVDHLDSQELSVTVQHFVYEGAAHSYDSKNEGADKEASDLSRARSLSFLEQQLK